MSKENEIEHESEHGQAVPEAQTDLVTLVKKMQQQLNALDKKIDILMSRPKENTFGPRRFAPQSRPFGRPSFHDRDDRRPSGRGEYRSAPRESFGGRDSFRHREQREGNFKEREPRDGQSFGKKPYHVDRSSGGGDSRGFAPRKKPFFLKRKER
jgi:hypothetical protein